MVGMNYDIPGELHRAFKALAARQGLTVKALLLKLMAEAVERDKNEGDGQ